MTRTVVVLVVVALIGVFGFVLYQEYSRGYQDGLASQKVLIEEAEEGTPVIDENAGGGDSSGEGTEEP